MKLNSTFTKTMTEQEVKDYAKRVELMNKKMGYPKPMAEVEAYTWIMERRANQ